MRSIFAIWSDNGRAEYGIMRPRLTSAGRLGIAITAFAVAGMGIGSIYSEMVANSEARGNSEVRDVGKSWLGGRKAGRRNAGGRKAGRRKA